MRKEEIKDTTKTVLTVVEERLQLIRNEITGVLILIEDNLHTSASKYGLEARGINLRLMEEKLIKLLYPDEEPDDKKEVIEEIYWEWVRKQGK